MTTGNGRDLSIVRAQLRDRLSKLAASDRLEALIEAPDSLQLVRLLPAEELYFTIAEVGLADAAELVRLASPVQFRTFVDLVGWKRDRIEVDQVLRWLRAARGGSPQEFRAKLHGLDGELLEFVLRSKTVIHDLEENPDIDRQGMTVETPDHKYLVEFLVEGPDLSLLRALLNDLISDDPFQVSRLLEAVRWELPSELEESAYQFRIARLQDLGFPPPEEAQAIFTFVDPESESRSANLSDSRTGSPRSELRSPATGRVDYLAAAMQVLAEDEQRALQDQLRYLINSVLVSEGADPSDLAGQRDAAEMARDYLALGFEYLTGGEADRAAEVLQRRSLRRVLQIGFSVALRLKFRADRLARQPLAQLSNTLLLLAPERAVVEAVRKKRPRRALSVEGAEPVAFRSVREIAEADLAIDRAEHQVAVFQSLLGGSEDSAQALIANLGMPIPVLGAQALFRASIVTAIFKGEAQPEPLDPSKLNELGAELFEAEAPPRLQADAQHRVLEVLMSAVPAPHHAELARMVGIALGELLSELGVPYLSGTLSEDLVSVVLPIRRRNE